MISADKIDELLYNHDLPKIYALTDDELILESADYFQAEQSPNQSESSSNQELWCNALAREFEVVAEYDPRPEGCVQTSDTRKKYFSQGKWSEVNPFHKEPPLQLPPPLP